MKPRMHYTTTLDEVLKKAFRQAAFTVYADRIGLYVVKLTSTDGFRFAERVYEKLRGPDPAILRERAQGMGVQTPHAVGSAPVEMLAGILETDSPTPREGAFRAWMVREMFQQGAVPVVMVDEETTIVTTLADLQAGRDIAARTLLSEDWGGWTRSVVGEA